MLRGAAFLSTLGALLQKNSAMTEQTFKVNLPQTSFPMRAGLPEQEPKWLDKWDSENLYTKLRKRQNPKGKFVLHCGPPYANGNFHMGHALSYVLKDFIVRAKTLAGYDAPLVPGWDCHGLPIEWQVEQNLVKEGKKKGEVSKAELRKLCRDWATKWIEVQKIEWRRMGVLADLPNPYRTMDFKNEADTVRILGKLVANGLVTKNLRPVYWSIVEQTALAEAEIEYADHTSTAVYVAFPVVGKANEYVVIWTTTPWTLPANKAVAYHQETDYVAVAAKGETYYVAAALADALVKDCDLGDAKVAAFGTGNKFVGWQLQHPFNGYNVPMLHGDHVTADAGTGFVHTAPAHGADDFWLGKAHGLELDCHVGPDGIYDQTVKFFAGQHVWKVEEEILNKLRESDALLAANKLTHSYPVSWRSKKPIIFRTTPQWFITMGEASDSGSLRARALKEIQQVQFTPASGINRITAMVADRPDWCISRQRAWGVPLAIFVDKTTGNYVHSPKAFEAVAKHMEQQGIDAWDALTVEQLLEGVSEAELGSKKENLAKETDILDVWFDSGTTWGHVVNARADLHQSDDKCDLYLEGSDQHRGWFQSSLLASVGAQGHAPYRGLLTHGYVVDGEGRKMSKSLGNGISPDEVYKEFGADIMRLWVATSDYSLDVRLSKEILKTSADAYRQVRNTLRYLVGNLHGFDYAKHGVADVHSLPALEKWVLARLREVLAEARAAYDRYEFRRAYEVLHGFCVKELSALYFDIRKDALYCDEKLSDRRRATQTALWHILCGLCTHWAPLMPFTSDEAWRSAFGEEAGSVHLQQYHVVPAVEADPQLWSDVWQLRDVVSLELEKLRTAKTIGPNMEAAVVVSAPETFAKALKGQNVDLNEVYMVAKIDLKPAEGFKVLQAGHVADDHSKCPRCWRFVTDIVGSSGLCTRCDTAEKQQAKEVAA